jgi:hypothetical protein
VVVVVEAVAMESSAGCCGVVVPEFHSRSVQGSVVLALGHWRH